MTKITIDGNTLEAIEGEYILEVARANDIFIPSICYLSKCSPTVACKMCMIEVDGKRAYACNYKVKEGINVVTHNNEIALERKAIMQSYAVNHPLECGVCDKSGECELQDFTNLMGVDKQDYFIQDSPKKMDFWSKVKYDPNLCILCERCVTTCKDNLGESNIKAIKQDYLPSLEAAYWKEKMPKDAFSVWNRKQKSLIGFVGENPCYDCAECASVCPVGALGVKEFQYTSNAWELSKISSTCALCPSGCKLIYESKKDLEGNTKIYRVTNDYNFNPICGGGRFGYDIYPDFKNNNLQEAIEKIKNAKQISVGGNITNDEARFLEQLRIRFNIKLFNEDISNYAKFLGILDNANLLNLEDIAKSKLIITIGSSIKHSNPLLRYKINNALKLSKDASFIYAHPLEDELISKLSKKYLPLHYKPNHEDIVILALLKILDSNNEFLNILNKYEISKTIEIKDNEKEEKIYYSIFEDSNITIEIYEKLQNLITQNKPLIIIGEDVYQNKNMQFIANVLSQLCAKNAIDLILNPPSANANGIISNLVLDMPDSNIEGITIGFRSKGDYVFDSVEADFKIPYFHSLKSSITNIDFRVLPLNPTFKANAYLEELANALNIEFESKKENLSNDYANDGSDKRGYKLKPKILGENGNNEIDISNIKLEKEEENINAYMRDLVSHFYPYTKFSNNFQLDIGVYTSKKMMQNLEQMGIKNGDSIYLVSKNIKVSANIYVDSNMNDNYLAISPQISDSEKLFSKNKFTKLSVISKIQSGE